MPVHIQRNREFDSPSPSPSDSTSSSSSSFVFKSKRYTQQQNTDPMAWLHKKPVLSQEHLLEHANGAVDLGPLAATIPGFTPFSFLKLKESQSKPAHTLLDTPGTPTRLPQSFQFPVPPKVQPLRPQPQVSSNGSFPSFSSLSSSVSFSSATVTPGESSSWRQNTYSLSLTELIIDESAESDEIEMRVRESVNAFPSSKPLRRRRKKRNSQSETKSSSTGITKPVQDSDKDDDMKVSLTPPKILYSKNSEKTRHALIYS